jgi:hypothetical protein
MQQIRVASKNGTLRFVYNDKMRPLLNIGVAKVKRASHVEPTPDNKWIADLSPVQGPMLGPFETREEALREEVAWLDKRLSTIPI